MPKAVLEPDKVWLRCGASGGHPDAVEYEMFCVDEIYVKELRQFVVELDSLVQKYENAINEINKLE
jgi:hypothetical protein